MNNYGINEIILTAKDNNLKANYQTDAGHKTQSSTHIKDNNAEQSKTT